MAYNAITSCNVVATSNDIAAFNVITAYNVLAAKNAIATISAITSYNVVPADCPCAYQATTSG